MGVLTTLDCEYNNNHSNNNDDIIKHIYIYIVYQSLFYVLISFNPHSYSVSQT